MKFDTSTLVVIGIMVFAAFGPSDLSFLRKYIPSTISVVDAKVPEPTSDLKSLVAPVTEHLKGSDVKIDSQILGNFYRDVAKYGVSDPKVNTKARVRQLNIEAGQAMADGRFKGKYPGLSQAINNVITAGLDGKVDGELNDEARQKIAKHFEAIAWACYQANNSFFMTEPENEVKKEQEFGQIYINL